MEPKNAALVIGLATAICAIGWFVTRSNESEALINEKTIGKKKSRSSSSGGKDEEKEILVSDILEEEAKLERTREMNKVRIFELVFLFHYLF